MSHDSVDAKNQLLKECRAIYRGNPAELSKIAEFERTYQACDAIHWYTKSCFLFRVINRAFRSENAFALYTLRYFIVDMCKSLQAMAATQPLVAIHVFRGTILEKEEIEKLNVDSLVATNGFLSCSLSRQVAESFIGIDGQTGMSPSRSRNDKYQFLLLEIKIDPGTVGSMDVTVANVSYQSAFREEDEVIFGLDTAFIVTEVEYDTQHYLWNIQMTVSSETAQLRQAYRTFINASLRDTTATCLFGSNLADIWSNYSQATMYFHNLLRTLPIEHIDRPLLYYHLGRVYRFLGKYPKAIEYLRCAELLQRRLLPQSTYDYGSTLGALGAVYSEMGDSARAVRLHERAIAVHSGYLPRHDPDMAFHANRLAYACFQEQQYERALSILATMETFFQPKMPAAHPSEAQVMHTKGLVYHALGNNELTLECFQIALRMRESWLAEDHPSVARTCYQLALLHEERGEYIVAQEHAKRALRIQQLKLPHTHQERTWSQEVVDRLQRYIDTLSLSE
jgi:tetratricopeptide (TPR) repeat protein